MNEDSVTSAENGSQRPVHPEVARLSAILLNGLATGQGPFNKRQASEYIHANDTQGTRTASTIKTGWSARIFDHLANHPNVTVELQAGTETHIKYTNPVSEMVETAYEDALAGFLRANPEQQFSRSQLRSAVKQITTKYDVSPRDASIQVNRALRRLNTSMEGFSFVEVKNGNKTRNDIIFNPEVTPTDTSDSGGMSSATHHPFGPVLRKAFFQILLDTNALALAAGINPDIMESYLNGDLRLTPQACSAIMGVLVDRCIAVEVNGTGVTTPLGLYQEQAIIEFGFYLGESAG